MMTKKKNKRAKRKGKEWKERSTRKLKVNPKEDRYNRREKGSVDSKEERSKETMKGVTKRLLLLVRNEIGYERNLTRRATVGSLFLFVFLLFAFRCGCVV